MKMITNLDQMRKKKLDIKNNDRGKMIDSFIKEFGLLDFGEFRQVYPKCLTVCLSLIFRIYSRSIRCSHLAI